MNYKRVCAGLGLLLIILWGGCQTAQTPREKDRQAKAYIEQAQAFENQGNLVEALEQFKLAQTIDPDDAVVTAGITRLEKQLVDLAESHYRAGLRFRDKGKWDLAKKEFLKALRFHPEHKNAPVVCLGCLQDQVYTPESRGYPKGPLQKPGPGCKGAAPPVQDGSG